MDILDILNESSGSAKDWVVNYGSNIPCLDRINKNLAYLTFEQVKLLKKKFSGIRNYYQLVDKLAEVLVASFYFFDKPLFQDDANSGPDLYLSRINQYVEVKCVNNSDYEKRLIDEISLHVLSEYSRIGSYEMEDEENFQKLINKTKELLETGASQIGDKPGHIFLVYSIDFAAPNGELQIDRSHRFEKNIIDYCCKRDIKIIMKKFNDLFFKRL